MAKAAGNRIRARIVWEPSNSNVFVTKPGAFTDLAVAAIEEVTGRRPELSTSGGTSDARFIASYCPVIEFGLVGQTMHQIDERTPVVGSGEADEDLSRRAGSVFRVTVSSIVMAGSDEPGMAENRLNNPPAPDTARPAARPGRRRRGLARPARRQDRRRSSGPRRPRPASPPSSAPGCAGTSAPRS